MTNNRIPTLLVLLAIPLVTTLLHLRIFQTDIIGPHAWRQTATQSNIDCFYEEDNNILHPRILARGQGDGIKLQEFPLFQWTVAQVYFITGPGVIVTRVVCFLIGILAWVGFFFLLRQLIYNPSAILAGSAMFMFSPLFYYYMINPLPDLLAFTCAIWSMAVFTGGAKKRNHLFFIGIILLCAAALCKLPYILFAGIPLGLLINYARKKQMRAGGWILLSSFVVLIPAVGWYVKVLPGMMWNPVVGGIFSETKEGAPLLDALIGNLVSSLPELYLNYASVLFFLAGFILLIKFRRVLLNEYLPFTLTGALLLCYFVYEIKLIATIHDYYMLPFIPLLFIIATKGWEFIFTHANKWLRFFAVLLVVATPVTAYLRIDTRWNPENPGFRADWLKHRDELRAAVPDDALVIMGSDHTQSIMPYYMHKRGWTYYDYELTKEKLGELISQGAQYLYTDCSTTLQDTSLRTYLAKEILVTGNVHVFGLHK